MKEQIVGFAMKDAGIYDKAQALHINFNTLVRAVNTLAITCNRTYAGYPAYTDEIWSFAGNKSSSTSYSMLESQLKFIIRPWL